MQKKTQHKLMMAVTPQIKETNQLSLPLYSISHIEQIVQPAKHTFSKLQFLTFPLDVQESWARYCHLPRGGVYMLTVCEVSK